MQSIRIVATHSCILRLESYPPSDCMNLHATNLFSHMVNYALSPVSTRHQRAEPRLRLLAVTLHALQILWVHIRDSGWPILGKRDEIPIFHFSQLAPQFSRRGQSVLPSTVRSQVIGSESHHAFYQGIRKYEHLMRLKHHLQSNGLAHVRLHDRKEASTC